MARSDICSEMALLHSCMISSKLDDCTRDITRVRDIACSLETFCTSRSMSLGN